MIDTHSHINMIEGLTLDEIILNAKNQGVDKIIIPCAHPKDIDEVMEITSKYDNVFALLGIHPSEAKDWSAEIENKIINYANNIKVAGIGETGLDYYWDKSFKDIQKDVFIKQIKLANKLSLPICVHDRDAHKDTYDILKEYNKCSKVVLHCFSGSAEFAKECIKEGWYLALGGVVTFKNASKTKEAAKVIPLDRLLLETDAPFLTPVPFRGKQNQPAYLKYIAEEIARIKHISVEEIADITSHNAENVYRLHVV